MEKISPSFSSPLNQWKIIFFHGPLKESAIKYLEYGKLKRKQNNKPRWLPILDSKRRGSNKTRLHQPRTKSICGSLFSPPGAERSVAEGAPSTLTSSSTLTNALRGNENISEFPPYPKYMYLNKLLKSVRVVLWPIAKKYVISY